MREIRMLRAMWRALETEPRILLNGHAGGNAGYGQGVAYGSPRQCSTLPGHNWRELASGSLSSSPPTHNGVGNTASRR